MTEKTFACTLDRLCRIPTKQFGLLMINIACFFLVSITKLLWRFSVTAEWSLTQRSMNCVSLVLDCGYEVPASHSYHHLQNYLPRLKMRLSVYVSFCLPPPPPPSLQMSLSFSFLLTASLGCSSPPFPMRSLRPPCELVWLLRAVLVLLETPHQYSY